MRPLALIFALLAILMPAIARGDVASDVAPPPGFQAHDAPTTPPLSYGYPAKWSPIQLGVVSYYQLFSEGTPIRGLRLGVLSNWSNDTSGISLAPIFNWGKRTQGLEVAGITNVTETERYDTPKASKGLAIAGIVNVHKTRFRGVRIAGICNVQSGARSLDLAGLWNAAEEFTGCQASLIYNGADRMRGLQLSGIVNDVHSERDPVRRTRVQVAGITNISQGSCEGLMACAFFNTVAGEIRGVQLGGFNKAKDARGLQLGIINDAQDLGGVQIGLFNFDRGRMRFPLLNLRLK
jgi:hypothetical protein